MAEIKRYNNLETQTLEGEWVKHSDHEAAIKAAVAAEREACCQWLDAYLVNRVGGDHVSTMLRIDRARGAAHE